MWYLAVHDLLRLLKGKGIKLVRYADDLDILDKGSFDRLVVSLIQGHAQKVLGALSHRFPIGAKYKS